jgi:hypothetical protein
MAQARLTLQIRRPFVYGSAHPNPAGTLRSKPLHGGTAAAEQIQHPPAKADVGPEVVAVRIDHVER